MTQPTPRHSLQLISLVKSSGELEVRLETVPVPEPKADEVIVGVEAAPINPSDLGLLFGAADVSTVRVSGAGEATVLTAQVPASGLRAMAGRIDQVMPVGNEGAGTVIAAGTSPAAQAALGRRVALLSGSMYAQFRCVPVSQCLLLPQGASAIDGASAFVNPLTALGMVETMRQEGHTALVHTAAASNLGQMLNRVCLADGVPLINIVRKSEQIELLRGVGAKYVLSSAAPGFMQELTDAIAETGATLAFDAIGGGKLAGQILSSMEAAISRKAAEYSRYGSTVHKQVYIYGALDRSPTELVRSFGLTWGLGGWLLFPRLQTFGAEVVHRMKVRVAAELTTTFASRYTHQVSLTEVLQLEHVSRYAKQATGEKFLLCPNPAA